MGLTAGAHLGPYEILAPLGAGGMGQVYKARDTRLDRIVAIKILRDESPVDPARRARFEREAHAVAALNHPNICQLFDVGEVASLKSQVASLESQVASPEPVRFLVMEYLEGQTLEERLVRGPLPMLDVLRIAIELADALDHAHRRGLIHRDLKPANVMLTGSASSVQAGSTSSPQAKTGAAKLLDFGIAKLQRAPDLMSLPTITAGAAPITVEGTIVGTYPYMAPEHLAGRDADARSDIFAFGAIVYEMATGRRAFEGTTAATVIGAILHKDPPPLSSLQALAPPELDRLIARALAKDPDDRWQTMRDLTLELKWIAEHSTQARSTEPRRNKALARAASLALGLAGGAAAAFTVAYLRGAPAVEPAMRLELAAPGGLTMADTRSAGPVTISPDGRRLAFAATGADRRQMLWVRPLDSLAAQPLPETDGGVFPFWSPDSRSLGFFAQGKLRKIQISGGPPQTLCDALQPRGGSWSRGNLIVFSVGNGHGLNLVAAGGGVPTVIPADGVNQDRAQPFFLPDGKHFLYYGRPQKYGLYAASIDSLRPTLIDEDVSAAAAYVPGYLLLLKGTSHGSSAVTLLARPFNPATLEATGEPHAVVDRVLNITNLGRAAFSASDTGTLVYENLETRSTRLTWYDRSGKPLDIVGSSGAFSQPSLARDEHIVGVRRVDPETQDADIWTIDQARKVESRVTSYGGVTLNPIWSPDGSRLIFGSARSAPPNLFEMLPGSIGSETRLLASNFNNQPTGWSPDGRFIVYGSQHPTTGWDLMLVPADATAVEKKPSPLLQTPFNEHFGRVSPDGRWFAYTSDESGSDEIYVQRFPSGGSKIRVSASGGLEPIWRGDADELFFLAPDGTVMAARVMRGADYKIETPVPLFRVDVSRGFFYEPTYTVSRDGRRFLINTYTEGSRTPATKIVFNWPAMIGRQ
jgi:serine/threonine protein kinase/Tol biopolymer transport system component